MALVSHLQLCGNKVVFVANTLEHAKIQQHMPEVNSVQEAFPAFIIPAFQPFLLQFSLLKNFMSSRNISVTVTPVNKNNSCATSDIQSIMQLIWARTCTHQLKIARCSLRSSSRTTSALPATRCEYILEMST